jgi:hypothetical protein
MSQARKSRFNMLEKNKVKGNLEQEIYPRVGFRYL